MPFDFFIGGGRETYAPGKILTIEHGDTHDPNHVVNKTQYISTEKGLAQRESDSPAGTPDTPIEPGERIKLEFDPETFIVVYPLPMSNATGETSPYDLSG